MDKNRTIIVKFKPTELSCIDYIELQDNYSNAIKYLIMKEVHENGMRNLSKFIPARLTNEYFDAISNVATKQEPNIVSIKSVACNENIPLNKELINPTPEDILPVIKKPTAYDISNNVNNNISDSTGLNPITPDQDAEPYPDSAIDESANELITDEAIPSCYDF